MSYYRPFYGNMTWRPGQEAVVGEGGEDYGSSAYEGYQGEYYGYNGWGGAGSYNKSWTAETSAPAPPDLFDSSIEGAELSLCLFFTKFGQCKKGDDCKYVHDKARVALCKSFLAAGRCSTPGCPLTHKTDPDRAPECPRFTKNDGQCQLGRACRFLHVKKSADAKCCPHFNKGFCAKGRFCEDRHEYLDKDGKLVDVEKQGLDALAAEEEVDIKEDQELKDSWMKGKDMKVFSVDMQEEQKPSSPSIPWRYRG